MTITKTELELLVPPSPMRFKRCGECGCRENHGANNSGHSTACSKYDHRVVTQRQDSEPAKICHHCARTIVWNRHWGGAKYSGGHWSHAILQADGKLENARMEQHCAGKPFWATPKRALAFDKTIAKTKKGKTVKLDLTKETDFECCGRKFKFGPSMRDGDTKFAPKVHGFTVWMWNGFYWGIEIIDATAVEGDLTSIINALQFKYAKS